MAVTSQKGGVVKVTGQVVSTELKTCAAIINIFHLIPAASTKMIEPLLALTLKGEKDLLIEVSDAFSHISLLAKLVKHRPIQPSPVNYEGYTCITNFDL